MSIDKQLLFSTLAEETEGGCRAAEYVRAVTTYSLAKPVRTTERAHVLRRARDISQSDSRSFLM